MADPNPKSKIQNLKSTVGLLFYRAHLLSGNTAFVDAIGMELQRRGLAVRAVYTQSLKESDAADLIKILHPELLPDHELVYYRHLAPTSQ